MQIKFHLGDKHPSGDGRVFMYQQRGKEYWSTEATVNRLRQRSKKKYATAKGGADFKKKSLVRVKKWQKTPKAIANRKAYRAKIRLIENAQQNARNKNPEKQAKLRAYAKKYFKRPNARLAENIRHRIKDVLAGKIKTDRTMKMLGCTAKQFMDHLQSNFEAGMNWNNYGKHGWHVDHILPLAMFDLSKPDHQRLAFNFRNCRPAWETENISKKDKLDLALVERFDLTEALNLINS